MKKSPEQNEQVCEQVIQEVSLQDLTQEESKQVDNSYVIISQDQLSIREKNSIQKNEDQDDLLRIKMLQTFQENEWVQKIDLEEFCQSVNQSFLQNNWIQIDNNIKEYCLETNRELVERYLQQQFNQYNQINMDKELRVNNNDQLTIQQQIFDHFENNGWIQQQCTKEFVEVLSANLLKQDWKSIQDQIETQSKIENKEQIQDYLKLQMNKLICCNKEINNFDQYKEQIIQQIEKNSLIISKYSEQFFEQVFIGLTQLNWNLIEETIQQCSLPEQQQTLTSILKQYYDILNIKNNNQLTSFQQHSDSQQYQIIQLENNQKEDENQQLKNTLNLEISQNKWIQNKFLEEFIQIVIKGIIEQNWSQIEEQIDECCLPKYQEPLKAYLKQKFDQLNNINTSIQNKQLQSNNYLEVKNIEDLNQQLKNTLNLEIGQNKWIQNKFLEEFIQIVFQGIIEQNWSQIEEQIDECCLPKYQEPLKAYLKQKFDQQKNNNTSIPNSQHLSINQQQLKDTLSQEISEKKWIQNKFLEEFIQIVIKGIIEQNWSQIEEQIDECCLPKHQEPLKAYLKQKFDQLNNINTSIQNKQLQSNNYLEVKNEEDLNQQLKNTLNLEIGQNKWIQNKFLEEFIQIVIKGIIKQNWSQIEEQIDECCLPKYQEPLKAFLKQKFNQLNHRNSSIENTQPLSDNLLEKRNQEDFNLQLKNKILLNIGENKWIHNKLLEDFTQNVIQGIIEQNWSQIEEQIDENCQEKHQQQVKVYLKEQFDNQKDQISKDLIVKKLKSIPFYSKMNNNQVIECFSKLKSQGLDQNIEDADIKEIFKIELEIPFIQKRDPALFKLYIENFSNQLKLTNNQLNLITLQGFDNYHAIKNVFQLNQLDEFEKELLNSKQLLQYIKSLNPLRFRCRLIEFSKKIKEIFQSAEVNFFLENNLEEKYLNQQGKLKGYVDTILNSNYQSEYWENVASIFFSNDPFQNFYVKCLIFSEAETELGDNQLYFRDIIEVMKQIEYEPLKFINLLIENRQNPQNMFENKIRKEINLFNSKNLQEFKLDLINLLIKERSCYLFLLKSIFQNVLRSFNLDNNELQDMFEQFQHYGLNYFHQNENIDELNQIIKAIKENELLKYIFGNDYYDLKLVKGETYFDFNKHEKEANKYNQVFSISEQTQINMDDFMRYYDKDYQSIDKQIKESILFLDQRNLQKFIDNIFNLVIQLSKRNQDLSPVFQKLSAQLLQSKNPNYNFNQKLVTEYLFMKIDKEVCQKLTHLLGYSNPVPLIISRPNKATQDMEMIEMKNIFWLLSQNDSTVVSYGFGYQRGKSQFLNDTFVTNFEISNKSFIFQRSADIQSNKIFTANKRDYLIVDFHGDSLDIDDKYFNGFYNYYLFQVGFQFLQTRKFDQLKLRLQNYFQNKNICFIIRDYNESKPNLQDYFNLDSVRQKLNIEYLNNKNVFILPDMRKVSRDDKNFLIMQSRKFLNNLIVRSIQDFQNQPQLMSKNLFSQHILRDEDEEFKIQKHINDICGKILNNNNNKDQRGFLVIYPIFQQYSRAKIKLTRKHFLQNQDKELKFQESDLDKQFLDLKIRYQNLNISSKQSRSQAALLFEEVISTQFNLYNTMQYFIKELKNVNELKLQGLSQQKKEIQANIRYLTKQKQDQLVEQIRTLEKEKQEIEYQIEDQQISIEIFWREMIQHQLKHPKYENNLQILNAYRNCINIGLPFEIIDGENFYFPYQYLIDAFNCEQFNNKKICVISIVGPQYSGKSTLLNYLLGCDFNVSDGRCTRGIYGTIIKSKVPEFDFILVIDSEGLQSLEKKDPEYDRKITLFCLTVSHLVIINVKDQLTNDMLQLLEVCISARQNIQSNTVQKPIIEIIFNQKADPNLDNAQQAIDNAMQSLDQNKLLSEIDTSNQNVTSLPNAVTSEIVNIGTDTEQWRYLKTQVDFVERVNQLGIRIINKLVSSFQIKDTFKNYKNTVESITQWVDLASAIYETIKLHPSLTAFKDIKQKQVDSQLKQYISQEIDQNFNSNLLSQIELDIEKQEMKIKQAELYVMRICEEKKEIIIQGYERMCKAFDSDIGELFERNRNYISIQIDSYYLNYINSIKVTSNQKKVISTLNQSFHTFEVIVKDLKSKNVSVDQARKEFEKNFEYELKNIRDNIPSEQQTNKDSLHFVREQYRRYYSDVQIPQEIVDRNQSQNIDKYINGEFHNLTFNKRVFYSTANQENSQFIFTNDSFEKHLKQLNKTMIDIDLVKEYYHNLVDLLNIAFSQKKNLKDFTSTKKIEKKNNKNIHNNYYQNWSHKTQQHHFTNTQIYVQRNQGIVGQNQYVQQVMPYNNNYDHLSQHVQSNNGYYQYNQRNYNENENEEIDIYDQEKVNQYNQALKILQLSIDSSFIKSQVEGQINIINNKQKLIIQGREEFIKVYNLKSVKREEFLTMQSQFTSKIKEHGWLKEKLTKLTASKLNKCKQELLYWKPFIRWIRTQLQEYLDIQDIVNIDKLVNIIKENILNKISGKKINEELIQSICGYINDELKQQEDNMGIFGIKFTQNFKTLIHKQALILLYYQDSRLRYEQLYKPIIDFESKKEQRKIFFMQKFEAQDNRNEQSSFILIQFIQEFSKNYIEQQLTSQIQEINNKKLENNISRLEFQQQIEASLTSYNQEEAIQYLNEPINLIQRIIYSDLERNLNSLQLREQQLLQFLITLIDDLQTQIKQFTFEINNQLKNDELEKQESILQRINENLRSSVIQYIEDFNQIQIEENKMMAFTEFLLYALLGKNSKILINNRAFHVDFTIPPTIKLQKQHCFIIHNILQNEVKKQILITDLNEFNNSFNKFANDLKETILNLNTLQAINARQQLSELEQKILSCSAKCPCCDQSCDQDHWKLKGVPIGENENKHISRAGHRFVAFKGVSIEHLNQPALLMCSDYEDQDLIVHKNQKMSWKDFKQNHNHWNWDFNFNPYKDPIIQRTQWRHIWKLVGRDICQKYGIKNYVADMSAEQIKNSKISKPIHFVFVFDESGSMTGTPFEGLKTSLKQFITQRLNNSINSSQKDIISLIGFTSGQIIHAQYEEISPQIINKIPLKNQGGGTNFQVALQCLNSTLQQNRKYDQNIVVVFLSDGEDQFPSQELDKIILEYNKKIRQFLIVGYGNSDFTILKDMALKLKEPCGGQYLESLNGAQLKQEFSNFAYIIPN